MSKYAVIETERLILRPFVIEDVDDIIEGLNNLNVSKWLATVPYPYTEQHAFDFLQKVMEDNSSYYFAIVLKSENKVIGGTQISNISHHNKTAGGGIWTSEAYWGHGYGSEAWQAKVKFAFENLGLRKLESGYFVGNEKSRNMQHKVGFKDEGIRREHFIAQSTGVVKDECITGLLRDEWIQKEQKK